MSGVAPNWTLTPDLPATKMLPTAPRRPLHLNDTTTLSAGAAARKALP